MKKKQIQGIQAALASAFFLGLAPVFGRQAILFGFSPLAVVALRTLLASLLLLFVLSLRDRALFYIFPVGLAGCTLAGIINGTGSILYYLALERLNANVGQLLYSLYPLFVAIGMVFDRQPPSKLTLVRIGLATIAVLLLTQTQNAKADIVGIVMMLGASVLYALHLPINQRVLYEVPAPTVTFYTLLAMSLVVVPAYIFFDRRIPSLEHPWWPIIGLTLVTFLSRLSLFLGVKRLGGMQTALLGLGELLVTIIASHFWLRESLSTFQWLGVILLSATLLLVRFEPEPERKAGKEGWLNWIQPPQPPTDIWTPNE
ncbi:MAG: DMT family transporter [Candidatus Villigracilaceae bacterium]